MLKTIFRLQARYSDWSRGRRQARAEWLRRKGVEDARQRHAKLVAIAARVRSRRLASEAGIRGAG